MRAYILKIVGVALIAVFSEYIVPKDWQKYMKLISGFIIISVIISPLSKGFKTEIFPDFEIDNKYIEEGTKKMYENIKTQLEEDVSADIKLRVNEEFSENVEAKVTIKVNDEGKIEKVQKIELFGEENPQITERLKFVYGTEVVIWN